MKRRAVVFLFNLIQDVNILRPLVYLSKSNHENVIYFLVSEKFINRDKQKAWQSELAELASATGAISLVYGDCYQIVSFLKDKKGIIFAGSESNLDAHDMTRDVFKVAHSGLLTVTLQHGYECIGFLQSHQHTLSHGSDITFEADFVAGWFPHYKQKSMVNSQKPKYINTGPTFLFSPSIQQDKVDYGLVCENLHSVRLSASGDKKQNFISDFNSFCESLAKEGKRVCLRPHPGGQYVIRNKVTLPINCILENNPIYKTDLSKYKFGISAPSSIIIDMVMANIPVAVWCDSDKTIDVDNYKGLHKVSSVKDIIEFERDSTRNPDKYLESQEVFLKLIEIQRSQRLAINKFQKLISSSACSEKFLNASNANAKVLFVANSLVPTLQLSFLKPLESMGDSLGIEFQVITEEFLKNEFNEDEVSKFIHLENLISTFNPTHVVFCRYSGSQARNINVLAKNNGIATIYHIDDDLLNIPANIGLGKFKHHNSEKRIASVRYLLDNVDLIYCSTKNLSTQLRKIDISNDIFVGEIYCPGQILNVAKSKPVTKIGYMASADHSHNLEMILDAISGILEKYPKVTLELFGSIPIPEQLSKFSKQIAVVPPVSNYTEFLAKFSAREWDVGLCPLVPIDFNLMKANTKWVEYTSSGIAVIASKGTAYDDCISDGCGILAETSSEWFDALESLILDESLAYNIKANAQKKLEEFYSEEHLVNQINEVLIAASKNSDQSPVTC